MASAAAVAADSARSPLGLEVDETNGIASKITGNDEEVEDDLFGEEDDDDDDDLPSRSRKTSKATVQSGRREEDDDDEDDLFGEDVDTTASRRRQLDDSELDSGDDEGRDDRDRTDAVEVVAQERTVQDVELPRLPVPEPSDGEMYLLKVPQFLSIEAKSFSTDEFEAPAADHRSKSANGNFSAYNTAMTTIRWRRSPSKPSELQSNARINRWSDGSLTLQFAANPQVQYEINGNALAPPQRNPVQPTPTSIHTDTKKSGRRGIDSQTTKQESFDPSKHAFTYLVMPLPGRGLIRVTNALTAGLTVSPQADFIDEAIVNLQSNLAAASGARKTNGSTAVEWTETIEDPELAKKRAEQAEREKLRARKKQDAQMERERERSNRSLGRHGLSSQRYGGLSAGMLEDDDGLATTRGGRAAPRSKPRRQRRANSEYSSEEDYGRRAFQVSKEDDYDVEDDFVAASDEEEEVPEEDDEDEDDGIIEEGRRARNDTPKRARDEDDADGEEDEATAAAADRKRKRLVVADDDDED